MHIRVNKTIKIVFSMFFISIGCKLLGFLRQMLLANCFGTGDVVDAYVLAQSIPNILFGGILVSFGASYMPLLSRRYEDNGIDSANEYTSHILTILFALSFIVAVFGIAFSSQITSIMASGLNENAKALTSRYVKFTFAYTYFAASAGIYSSYLQYKGIFSRQIIGDYIQNLFFISFIWVAYLLGDNFLILGLFFGYVFRVLYLRFLVGRHGFKLKLTLNGLWEDLREIKNYAIPIFVATTATEINAFVDRTLASRLDSGSISALNYAHQLSTVFMELTITILATVLFPKLVQTFTRNEIDAYRTHVKRGIILCSLISIPLALGCIVFSRQIIELVFERGAFASDSTLRTGNAFLFYSIGMFSSAVCTYLGKVYFSADDMKTPMICAAAGVAVNIVGDFALVNIMKENGLALATSIASIVNAFMLMMFYKKKQFKLFDKYTLKEAGKILFASLVAILIGLLVNKATWGFETGTRKILFLGVCVVCALSYLTLIILLRVEEIKWVIGGRNE